jgi:hypothetical protein
MASVPVPEVENLPEKWDWRHYGILTTPRNQVINFTLFSKLSHRMLFCCLFLRGNVVVAGHSLLRLV